MWRKLSQKKQIEYYNKWIAEIIKDETPLSIKRHIVHHAKEIYGKGINIQEWSSSMKNLIDTFDKMNRVESNLASQLERLAAKYKKNPRRYTPPPKI